MILVLLVISLLGPWMFDRIHVPAEYTCSEPTVRLYGDFCGYPMPGFFTIFLFIGGFFSNLAAWVSGAFTGRAREFLVGLSLLPILPFFTTLFLIWKEETRRLRTINLVAWILALIPTLIVFILQIKDQAIQPWGLWLYILVAIGAIIHEVQALRREKES